MSEGCRNCYAERVAARFSGPEKPYEGLAVMKSDGPHWTGEVEFIGEHLTDPFKWKKSRRIFVNSMSDLFHERVIYGWAREIFDVMAELPQHTFQILTKRPKRMLDFAVEYYELSDHPQRPLENVWLGVSVEDQAAANERIPLLLETPAAVRWVSYEPALGPVNFEDWLGYTADQHGTPSLDWLVCGGESGPGARPMHPDWARSARDQCVAAGVPFFFKQWGEWSPGRQMPKLSSEFMLNRPCQLLDFDGCSVGTFRVGKKKAGRLLDGREWNKFPNLREVTHGERKADAVGGDAGRSD